jgi:WD40 repeat protein
MKINIKLDVRPLLRAVYVVSTMCLVLLAMPRRAEAQVYVSQPESGVVSEYDLATGKLINANFITGLNTPNAMVISGNDLLIANGGGSVGKYNAKTGAAISQSFITGTDFTPCGLALSGEDLYVASSGEGTVGKYSVVSGKAINASLITGLPSGVLVFGVGVSGGSIYVALTTENSLAKYTGAGTLTGTVSISAPYGLAFSPGTVFVGTVASDGGIGTYKATTGKPLKPDLITGLNSPYQIARLGTKLFVTNFGAGTIGEYDATTGKAINASFISGIGSPPAGLAIKK